MDFVEKPTDPEVISRLVPPELKASGIEQDRCLASMEFMFLMRLRWKMLSVAMPLTSGKKLYHRWLVKDIRCHVFDDYWEDIGTVELSMLTYNLLKKFKHLIFMKVSVLYIILTMFCPRPSLVSVRLPTQLTVV